MAVFRRRGRWAVAVYSPTTQGKTWVGTFSTRREAQDAERQALATRKPTRHRQTTVDQFADRWLDDYPRRPSTSVVMRHSIRKLAQDFAGRPLDSIDRHEARVWILDNRYRLPVVRAMFSDAVRDGLCETNPFAKLRLPSSRGRRDLIVPTEGELEELITEAAKLYPGWGAAVFTGYIRFAAYSGLRPGETAALRWADLDFENERIRVERQFSSHTRKIGPPKYNSRRMIYMAPQAAAAVQGLPRARGEVFSTPRGGLLTPAVASTHLKPAAASIGRPELTPHALRHFFGTQLARLGLGPPEIALAMGHTDGGQLALSRYVHISQQEANEKMARAFGSTVRRFRTVSEAGR